MCIFLSIMCILQYAVIVYYFEVSKSKEETVKSLLEIIRVKDTRIRNSIEYYNIALEREIMLLDELEKSKENTKL